jgi:hypothetical protein
VDRECKADVGWEALESASLRKSFRVALGGAGHTEPLDDSPTSELVAIISLMLACTLFALAIAAAESPYSPPGDWGGPRRLMIDANGPFLDEPLQLAPQLGHVVSRRSSREQPCISLRVDFSLRLAQSVDDL